MKKVLAAALICAVSSFAAWDYFPVKEAGKGEAKLGVQYDMPAEKTSSLGINLAARYTVIEGLEVALLLNRGNGGFVVMKDAPDAPSIPSIPVVPGVPVPAIPTAAAGAGKDAKGLNQPVIGVRYWLPLGLGFFADVALPFGSEKLVTKEPALGLDAGAQYSIKLNEQLAIGSQAGVSLGFGDFDIGLGIAVEVDYSLGAITPWLAIDFGTGLTKGDKQESSPADIGVEVGFGYNISDALYANAYVHLGVAGDANKDNTPITIGANVGTNF